MGAGRGASKFLLLLFDLFLKQPGKLSKRGKRKKDPAFAQLTMRGGMENEMNSCQCLRTIVGNLVYKRRNSTDNCAVDCLGSPEAAVAYK